MQDEDKAILQALAYKLRHNLTNDAFADLPKTFPIEHFPSIVKIRSQLAFISGIVPQVFDCCPQSCMAYTGPLKALTQCLYCKTSRFDEYGNAHHRYSYIPFKDCLLALHRDKPTAKLMDYHAEFKPTPDGGV